MSWLNDSFNKLTNLAKEVLEDNNDNEASSSSSEKLSAEEKHSLQVLCDEQERKIGELNEEILKLKEANLKQKIEQQTSDDVWSWENQSVEHDGDGTKFLSSLQSRIQGLEAENSRLLNELETLNAQNALALKSDIDMKQQCAQKDETIIDLQQSKLEQLETLKATAAELEKLKGDLSMSRSTSSGSKHTDEEFILIEKLDTALPQPTKEETTDEKQQQPLISLSPESEPDDIVEQFQTQLEQLKAELDSKDAQLQQCKRDFETMQQEFTVLQDNEAITEMRYKELESRLLLAEQEKEKLQEEAHLLRNESTCNEIKLLKADLRGLEDENESLRNQLEVYLSESITGVERHNTITDLDADADADADANDNANGDADAQNDGNSETSDVVEWRDILQAYMDQVKHKLTREIACKAYELLSDPSTRHLKFEKIILTQLREIQNAENFWVNEIETLRLENDQYMLQCHDLMAERAPMYKEMEKLRRNKLQTIDEAHEATILALEIQAVEHATQIKQLEEELEKARLVNEASVSRVAELNTANAVIKNMQRELTVCNTELETVRANLDDADSALAVTMEDQTESLRKYDILKTKYKTMKVQLKEAEDTINVLNVQVANYLDIKRKVETQEENARKYEFLKAKYTIIKEQLNNAEDCIEELSADIAECKEENKKVEKLYEDLQKDFGELHNQIQKISKEKNEEIERFKAERTEIAKYLKVNDDANLPAHLGMMLTQMEIIDRARAAAEASKIELKSKLENCRLSMNLLRQSCDKCETTEKQIQHHVSELQRLRAHLEEKETLHTAELVEAQQQLDQANAEIKELEAQCKRSSQIYTSVSARANQQAETLQSQYGLIVKERNELLQKLSASEDSVLKHQAALTNLQCALEQLQDAKEKEMEARQQRALKEQQIQQKTIEELNKTVNNVQGVCATMKQRMHAMDQALAQTALLKKQNADLQEDITNLTKQIETLQLQNNELNHADKIDKNLIKSFLIGWLSLPAGDDKQNLMQIISDLLTFSEQDAIKAGLIKSTPTSTGNWFSSLLGTSTAAAVGHASGNAEQLISDLKTIYKAHVREQKPLDQTSQEEHKENLENLDLTQPTAIETEVGSATPIVPSINAPIVSMLKRVHMEPYEDNDENDFPSQRNSSTILKDILNNP